MLYIIFAGIMLGVATVLLFVQYRRVTGTPGHAKRGWIIFTCAIKALGAIEYALWVGEIRLERNLPLLILHLSFALPMFVVLCVTVASGMRAYRRRCVCPTVCDCQNPEPKQGVALVSYTCPVHNECPDPYPNCRANVHRQIQAGLPTHRYLVRYFPWLWTATIVTGLLYFSASYAR